MRKVVLEIVKDPRTRKLSFRPHFDDKAMYIFTVDESFFNSSPPRNVGELYEAHVKESRQLKKKTKNGRAIILCSVNIHVRLDRI